MVKIGILGCGWIVEKAHIPAFRKNEDVSIQAIYDLNNDRLDHISKKYQIPNKFNDLDNFLEHNIDAVIVASPNFLHTKHTNLVLEAGKHVLCEKPIALSTLDYKNTLKIAEENKKLVIPAFVNRFRPDVIKLNKKLLTKEFGKLKSIKAEWLRKSGIPRPGTWITNKSQAGGGVLVDLGSHLLDICLMHIKDKRIKNIRINNCETDSEMKSASWYDNQYGKKFPIDVETAFSGNLKFQDKVELNFNISWNSDVLGDYTKFNFGFEKASISLSTLFGFSNNSISDVIEISVDAESYRKKILLELNSDYARQAFENQAQHFINAITTGNCKDLNPADGYHVVNVIEKLYESVK